MKEQLGSFRGTVTAKVLFIAFLVLALLVPAWMIEGLIRERGGLVQAARADIANSWGRAQTIGGPMLIVPFRYSETVDDELRTFRDALYVLPESLSIEGTLVTETLRRGIYEVPVYTATLAIGGVLPPPRFDDAYQDLEIQWSEAEIALPLSDARPIAAPVRLRLADGEAAFEAGAPANCFARAAIGGGLVHPCPASPANRLVVPYPALGIEPLTAMQSFALDVTLRGTGRLHFLPLGDVTDVRVASSWPSPSFEGAFLPSERAVSDRGFTASWRVLGLGRGFPSTWLRSEGVEPTIGASSFGVDLIVPIGVHEASLRAAKYAVLFFGLTFLVYFLFEIFASLRLHPLQYLAVGMANCMFFLLLLALGEHVGFGAAYVASALASTALIGGYSAAILGAGRRALPVVGLLAIVYLYLYATLKAEDYALLLGALGLFAVLAAFMALTRRVDWYAVRFEGR